MTKTITQIEIRISCPSTMEDEMNAIKTMIDELNEIHLDAKDIRLKARHWRADSVGQVSVSPQVSITKQLFEDYDILLAIIGPTLGTPTDNAESGTAEEIDLAINKDGAIFSNMHVQVFFAKTYNGDIDQLDVKQLDMRKKYKETLSKNLLIKEFISTDELVKLASMGLMTAINKFENKRIQDNGQYKNSTQVKVPQAVQVSNNEVKFQEVEAIISKKPGDDLEYFDRFSIFDENIIKAAGEMSKSAEEMDSLTAVTEVFTNEMESNDGSFSSQKKLLDQYGDRLKASASKIINCAVTGANYSEVAFDGMDGVLLSDEFAEVEIESSKDEFKKALTESLEQIQEYRDVLAASLQTVSSLPKATSKFKAGRNEMILAIKKSIETANMQERRMCEYLSFIK